MILGLESGEYKGMEKNESWVHNSVESYSYHDVKRFDSSVKKKSLIVGI